MLQRQGQLQVIRPLLSCEEEGLTCLPKKLISQMKLQLFFCISSVGETGEKMHLDN